MENANEHNSPDRLERIERIVEVLANTQSDLQQDVKILLRGQIAMDEALTKLAEAQRRTDQIIKNRKSE